MDLTSLKKLCIIPARGGSKRIPKKNIKNFLGKPIISYSISAALNSNLFNEVMVSTDDIEIAKISENFGAKIPFIRSEKNSNDIASTADVIREVLNWYINEKNLFFDIVCCLYATAPFVNPSILNEGLEKLINYNFDSLYPIIKYSYPIQRALIKNDDNKISMLDSSFLNKRSQDLQETFHDAGQFYLLDVNKFLNTNSILSDNTGAILMDDIHAHDIDTIKDWEIAEFKYKLLNTYVS